MRSVDGPEAAPAEPAVAAISAVPPATTAPTPAGAVSYAELQRLVDRAANIHAHTVPAGTATVIGNGNGLQFTQPIQPMAINPFWPERGSMRASSGVGAETGQIKAALRWIPNDNVAHPDRPSPDAALTPGVAQRFALRDCTLSLSGQSGFRLFGTGRAFPSSRAGRNQWMIGAVCDIVGGFGAFAGLEGNCTWAGDFDPIKGFCGHIMIRVRDPHGRLVSDTALPPMDASGPLEPGVSYLTWLGQKSPQSRLANSASVDATGQVRGLNIPVDSKLVFTGWALMPALRAAPLNAGEVIGLEIGFGRESAPRSPLTGNGRAPYQFEGCSKYFFYDRSGATVGTLTANVLEGRSMAVNLEGAPGQPALRFGFFGPVITGTGCFAGVRGMLYGASGSIFNPPPLDHVISNWYTLRLYDAEGKFRAGGGL